MAVDKVLQRILSGTADAAIRFADLCHLLENLGFEQRVRGSLHLFRKCGIAARAKPYQVKQVRAIILEAKLGGQ